MQYHIRCTRVPEICLLPGDPARAEHISEFLENPECIAKNREFWSFKGKYEGTEVGVTSTGIGAPSTAIALEELARCGAKSFIRVGTCGAYRDAEIGELAVIRACIRNDGTGKGYVPLEYPAVASLKVTLALLSACKELNYKHFCAISDSDDALYANDPFLPVDTERKKKSALGDVAEMEASILFVLSSLYSLNAGAICSVVNRIGESTEHFVYDNKNIDRMIRCALKGAAILDSWRDKYEGLLP
ncbi:MAG: nucleoside phosphorylase [Candidatus Thermoplasmatota archaeon]|nr:nucleoside phosphorylase [Candidatus Thermoplasmatota archaeon]